MENDSQPKNKTLKEHRIALNKSQEDVARDVGVKQQAVSLWESGKKYPTLDNAVRLANSLNITLEELAKSMNLIEVKNQLTEETQK